MFQLIKAIGRWWRKSQRKTDMTILWPQCLHSAGKRYEADRWRGSPYTALDLAKVCFMAHADNDTAWTKDFTHEEIKEFIDKLRPGDRTAP